MKCLEVSFDLLRKKGLLQISLTSLAALVILAACQGTMLSTNYIGQSISPSARIQLVQTGQQSGQFADGYVTVDFKYTTDGGSLQMFGKVKFGSAIVGNFQIVETFDLGLLLADAQGKILLQQGLTTAVANDVSQAVDFKTTIVLPARAVFMAFTYNGQAYGGSGESPTSFWADPVER